MNNYEHMNLFVNILTYEFCSIVGGAPCTIHATIERRKVNCIWPAMIALIVQLQEIRRFPLYLLSILCHLITSYRFDNILSSMILRNRLRTKDFLSTVLFPIIASLNSDCSIKIAIHAIETNSHCHYIDKIDSYRSHYK